MRAQSGLCSPRDVRLIFILWTVSATFPVDSIGFRAEDCHRFIRAHCPSPFLEVLICRKSELVPDLKVTLSAFGLSHFGVLSALHVTVLMALVFAILPAKFRGLASSLKVIAVFFLIYLGQGNPSLRFLLSLELTRALFRGWLPVDQELLIAALAAQVSVWTSTPIQDWSSIQISLVLTWGAYLSLQLSAFGKKNLILKAVLFWISFSPVAYWTVGSSMGVLTFFVFLLTALLSFLSLLTPILEVALNIPVSEQLVSWTEELSWRWGLATSNDVHPTSTHLFGAFCWLLWLHTVLRALALFRHPCTDETPNSNPERRAHKSLAPCTYSNLGATEHAFQGRALSQDLQSERHKKTSHC